MLVVDGENAMTLTRGFQLFFTHDLAGCHDEFEPERANGFRLRSKPPGRETILVGEGSNYLCGIYRWIRCGDDFGERIVALFSGAERSRISVSRGGATGRSAANEYEEFGGVFDSSMVPVEKEIGESQFDVSWGAFLRNLPRGRASEWLLLLVPLSGNWGK